MRDVNYVLSRIADGVDLLAGDPEYKAATQRWVAEMKQHVRAVDVAGPDLYDYLIQTAVSVLDEGENEVAVPVYVLDWMRSIIRKHAQKRADAAYFADEIRKIIGG